MEVKDLVTAVCGTIVKVVIVALLVSWIYKGATLAYDYGYRIFEEPPVATGEGRTVTVTIPKGMSAKETYDFLMEVRNRVQHCIVPNDLFYLKKGGRVSAVSAAFGTMLNIKPMLTFDVEGKLKVLEKCKGMKKAFSRVTEHINAAPIEDFDGKSFAVIVHTNNEKGAQDLAALVEERTGVKPRVTIMGPVIGSHVGPGSVSCCWISTKTRKELFDILY